MAIVLEHISKHYHEKTVLRQVSLDIGEGQFTAFIGPNGAGKSTLLGIMSRLMNPDAGQVMLDGENLQQMKNAEIAKKMAILKQGVVLRDGTQLLPASVDIIGEDMQTVQIRICEGKYHQIKRMLAAVGNRVTALRRTHMGALPLDTALPPGACREITPEELNKICE